MLELQNVTKIYKTKSNDVVALDDINLYFEEKGMVFITGKSGSGKTTMLNVIGGLDNFDSGKLIVKGKSFDTFNQKDFDSYRNSFIGFVFQEYNLLEEMTVEKNISLAMELQGQRKKDTQSINDLLKKVDLEGVNTRHPSELSGGQKQRIAIARALIKKPQIILTDEPTGALDTQSGIQVMDLLKELSKERLVIIVSHNLELAHDYADRVIQMKDGRIERDYQIVRDTKSGKLNMLENDAKLYVRRGAKLTQNEVKTLVDGISNSKDVQIVDEQKFSVEKPTVIENKKQYVDGDCKFVRGRLGILNNLKMGFANLKIKPLRLFVTILLCAVAFSIFGLFDTMAIYDQGRLTANTLRNSNAPSVILSASYKTENDDVPLNVSQKLIDEVNGSTNMNFKGVFKVGSMLKPTEIGSIAFISKYYAAAKLAGVIEYTDEEFAESNMELLYGKLPTEYDEIAITKYYAQCIINWGYVSRTNTFVIGANNFEDITIENLVRENDPITLTINNRIFKISGIVDAGDISSKYDSILEDYGDASTTLITEFNNYIANSMQMYAIVKDGFVDNYYKSNKDLIGYKTLGYNYKFSFNPNRQFTEFYSYSDMDVYEDSVYFFDEKKTELNDNEVLVNAFIFDSLFAEGASNTINIKRFKDIVENDRFNRYEGYSERMDDCIATIKTARTTAAEKTAALKDAFTMLRTACGSNAKMIDLTSTVIKYDTTKYAADGTNELVSVPLANNEYTIVGFYTTGKALSAASQPTIVLTDEGLNNLGVDTRQGAYSSLIAPTTRDTGKINEVVRLVTRTRGVVYTSSNNVISIINLNKDFLNKMSLLFLIASGIFAIFAVAMMANYIATSITNKHTEIGILRALGSSGADVLTIFLTESIIIALINIVLSNVLTGLCCLFINNFLMNIMNISITLASYTGRQFGIICALSLAVATLASIIPIVKLSKQKPIEAIRRN